MKKLSFILSIALALVALGFSMGCKEAKAPSDVKSTLRGEPTLVCDTLIFEEDSKTFNLKLHADSTADAKVTFFLLDGDSILMQNEDGRFSGISPLEEGYNVQLRAEWEDTVIMTPLTHVLGFAIPREPVEKIQADELQKLINARDKSLTLGNSPHLAQGFKVVVTDTHMKASSLQDVVTFLNNGVWNSVTVTHVDYDDNNLVTSITLKPVGESIDEEDYEEDF